MSQRLILPFKQKTLISASYKNNAYMKNHGFAHYGLDCGCEESGYKVYGCGQGTVVACGLNNGALNKGLGNCVVIKYPDVECNDGKIRDLSCRMFHFDKIYVKQGQNVNVNTVIGDYGNTGIDYDPSNKTAKHLHIEFGSNYSNPDYSIGIAVNSTGMVIKRTTSDISLDPSDVWFLGSGQSIKGVTTNWYSNKDINIPKIDSTINKPSIPSKNEFQKLILPVNNMLITASYKNKKYESLPGNTSTGKMGVHYGMDFCNDLQIWGSGNGLVIKTGIDSCFGNFVVVKHENVYNHKLNKVIDIVLRYFHLNSISVKTGDKITKDTKIGIMGKTGIYAKGIHCHLEADTDINNWQFTPTLVGNTTYFRAGTRGSGDTTFNPLDVMYIKASPPDNQKLLGTQDGYTNPEDLKTPKLM